MKRLVIARIVIQAWIGYFLARIVWDLLVHRDGETSWVLYLFLIPAAAWILDCGLHLRWWLQARRAVRSAGAAR